MHIVPPDQPLSDGVVTLRLPSADAGDFEAAASYSEEEGGLDGAWMPMIPGEPPRRWVEDWLEGWAGRPCHNGPTLLVTIGDEPRFIGIVGLGDPDDQGSVEIIYGIAPRWRGRGLASRAVGLAARWALAVPGVRQVEARVDQHMPECQRVAANAGFREAGTVTQFVPGTGETYEDLRFILTTTD